MSVPIATNSATTSPLLNMTIKAAEQAWLQVACLAWSMNDYERHGVCLDHALRLNPFNSLSLWYFGRLSEQRKQILIALESYQRALSVIKSLNAPGGSNPYAELAVDLWAGLGRCFLLMDDLPKSYQAFQQALIGHQTCGTAPDGSFWYSIGMMYERYGSEDHALEAYVAASKDATKLSLRELYFRLGTLLRNRGKFDSAMDSFKFVLTQLPQQKPSTMGGPVSIGDVLLQMALVEDMRGEYAEAKEILDKLSLEGSSRAGKAHLFLGWLYARSETPYHNTEEALRYLTRYTTEEDPNDCLGWYYLGRLHAFLSRYTNAYEAYQRAVQRDSRNCAVWNSIGLLYTETGQFRDALDAFTRALQISPSNPTIWQNLGNLYELSGNDPNEARKKVQELTKGAGAENGELNPLKYCGRWLMVVLPLQRPVNTSLLATLPVITSSVAGGVKNMPGSGMTGKKI